MAYHRELRNVDAIKTWRITQGVQAGNAKVPAPLFDGNAVEVRPWRNSENWGNAGGGRAKGEMRCVRQKEDRTASGQRLSPLTRDAGASLVGAPTLTR